MFVRLSISSEGANSIKSVCLLRPLGQLTLGPQIDLSFLRASLQADFFLPLPLQGSLVYSSSPSSFGTITSSHLKSACSYQPRTFISFSFTDLTVSHLSSGWPRNIHAYIARWANRIFRNPKEAATLAKESQRDPTDPYPYAEKFDCHELFSTESRQRRMLEVNITRTEFPVPTPRGILPPRNSTSACLCTERCICPAMFRSKSNTEAHKKVRYPCHDPKCQEVFTTKRYVATHVKKVHPTLYRDGAPLKIASGDCGKAPISDRLDQMSARTYEAS